MEPHSEHRLAQTQQRPTTTPNTASETTPLLSNEVSTPSSHSSAPSAVPKRLRPGINRATSVPNVASRPSPSPLFSRPTLNRSSTATTMLGPLFQRSTTQTGSDRPSLLRRATDVINSTLELTPDSSYAHKNRPATPSHWTDHAHRNALLKTWDAADGTLGPSKYARCSTALLVKTEKQMLQEFPELAEGEVSLTREWLEYVLGVNLRHPFCTSEKMGRWQVLASSGGMRGNWGPF